MDTTPDVCLAPRRSNPAFCTMRNILVARLAAGSHPRVFLLRWQADIAAGDNSFFSDEKSNVTLGSVAIASPFTAAGSSFVLNPLAGVVSVRVARIVPEHCQ